MATMPATATSQDVARRLTDDGYVVVTGVMTPDGVQRARADLDRVLRTTRTGRNPFEGFDTQRIYALFAKTRVFDAPATDPLLLESWTRSWATTSSAPRSASASGPAR